MVLFVMFKNRTKLKTIFRYFMKYLFSHIGLFMILSGYCIGGAYMFQYIESPGIQKRIRDSVNVSKRIKEQSEYLLEILNERKCANDFNETAKNLLDDYGRRIAEAIQNHNYIGIEQDERDIQNGWVFPSALLFTITIVTTIGYGHVTPKTPLGQILVIPYALFGVPLMLMFLANIGDFMARSFRFGYTRVCCCICWIRRKKNQNRKSTDQDPVVDLDDEMLNVPISLTIVVAILYMFLGAILFATWNGWTWVQGAYFTFVTVTTIGFGDFIPGWQEVGTTIGNLKLVVSCLYIIFGLAVLSMSFNLMMDEMIAKIKWLGQQMGIIRKDDLNVQTSGQLTNGQDETIEPISQEMKLEEIY